MKPKIETPKGSKTLTLSSERMKLSWKMTGQSSFVTYKNDSSFFSLFLVFASFSSILLFSILFLFYFFRNKKSYPSKINAISSISGRNNKKNIKEIVFEFNLPNHRKFFFNFFSNQKIIPIKNKRNQFNILLP